MDYNEIVNHEIKAFPLRNGLKFLKITLHSVEEARTRALLVSWISYSLKSKMFYKFFTKPEIDSGFFLY